MSKASTTPSKGFLVFNTFRSHVSGIRTALFDGDEATDIDGDGEPELSSQRWFEWQVSPRKIEKNNVEEKRTQQDFYHQESDERHGDTEQYPCNEASWSLSEKIFFSHDVEEVSVTDDSLSGGKLDAIDERSTVRTAPMAPPAPSPAFFTDERIIEDDDNCTNTMLEKSRQRTRKATQASSVSAAVVFLKALFGIGMLSNPAVLGEVGLVLGTALHLFIVVGCAFACYLLLTARKMALKEVRRKEELLAVHLQKGMTQERHQLALPIHDNYPSPQQTDAMSDHRTQALSISTEKIEAAVPSIGWGRCRDSLHYAAASSPPANVGCSQIICIDACTGQGGVHNSLTYSNKDDTRVQPEPPHCENGGRGESDGPVGLSQHLNSTNGERGELAGSKAKGVVTCDYLMHTDNATRRIYRKNSTVSTSPRQTWTNNPPTVRLVTYGDIAHYLAGPQMASIVTFTIVTVHIMFASGMVSIAVENLCYIIGWDRLGWGGTAEEEGDGGQNRRFLESADGDENSDPDVGYVYAEWEGPGFVGRIAMASLLFPIIQGLLQIPSLRELAPISSFGLCVYVVGCIGSMLYAAIVLTNGHPFIDQPDDMWETKWSGIPTYVATTIYAIEGINLALPTASSLEGTERVRWGGKFIRKISGLDNEGEKDRSIFVVVAAVVFYGMVTLVVSWVGLAGGLGGGIGTTHGEDGCWDVTYCFDSSTVRFVYMLSLGVALILTLPVILFPSTQMLELWMDEREVVRQRRMTEKQKSEAAAQAPTPETVIDVEMRQSIREKSIFQDDDTMASSTTGCISTLSPVTMRGSASSMTPVTVRGSVSSGNHTEYRSPKTCEEKKSESTSVDPTPTDGIKETTKIKTMRRLKYWKLRMFLAFIICLIGTLEGSVTPVIKASETIRGVGLSMAGFIFPPLLYMSAVGGRFSATMASSMALLIGLGLCNIILVLMSVFTEREYIVEDGPGGFHVQYSTRR